jgi:hypothetical protein
MHSSSFGRIRRYYDFSDRCRLTAAGWEVAQQSRLLRSAVALRSQGFEPEGPEHGRASALILRRRLDGAFVALHFEAHASFSIRSNTGQTVFLDKSFLRMERILSGELPDEVRDPPQKVVQEVAHELLRIVVTRHGDPEALGVLATRGYNGSPILTPAGHRALISFDHGLPWPAEYDVARRMLAAPPEGFSRDDVTGFLLRRLPPWRGQPLSCAQASVCSGRDQREQGQEVEVSDASA